MKRAALTILAGALALWTAGCPPPPPAAAIFAAQSPACGGTTPPGAQFTITYSMQELLSPWDSGPGSQSSLQSAEVTFPERGLNLVASETTALTQGCELTVDNPLEAPFGGIYTFNLDCEGVGGAIVQNGKADAPLFTATFEVVLPDWTFDAAGPFVIATPECFVPPCPSVEGVGIPGAACTSG